MTATLADRARVLWRNLRIIRRCYPDTTWPDMLAARAMIAVAADADDNPRIRQIAAHALGRRASPGNAA